MPLRHYQKFKWRGDIQEQRGTFEALGQAAYRGWIARFAGKWALLLAPFSFGSFSFGRAKENEHGLRTTKCSLNYSLRGWHYPEHFKNVA